MLLHCVYLLNSNLCLSSIFVSSFENFKKVFFFPFSFFASGPGPHSA
jgi:hypothetical protein